jgi:hypothetical protein
MGLGPDIWGPHGWKFFHFVALGYSNNPSNEDKQNYKNFFTMIPKILPCSICSNHYIKNLKKHPITDEVLSNRANLLNWTIDMHNEVNISNNKKPISYENGLNLVLNNFLSDKIDEHQITHQNKIIDYENDQICNSKLCKKSNKHRVTNYMYYIILFILIIIILIGFIKYK